MAMRKAMIVLLVLLGVSFAGWSHAASAATDMPNLPALARQAVSVNNSESGSAIAALRAMGPDGLQALLDVHQDVLHKMLTASATQRDNDTSWKRLCVALDAVGRQRDNWASQLYWYTDLEAAKAAAKAAGKPILSLRLLGNLDEELSCANSRFFRTALYPNAQISRILRERYILHWKSVRPVPKVSIDFGDGRKIETTITGNSIHYVLDAEGRPVEALPGLHGPQAFLNWLQLSERVARESATRTGTKREELLRRYHQERAAAILANWQRDAARVNAGFTGTMISVRNERVPQTQKIATSEGQQSPSTNTSTSTIDAPANVPTARRAGALPITKYFAETPLLQSIPIVLPRDRDALNRTTDDAAWTKIAALHSAEARLDDASLAVLRSKTPNAEAVAKTFEQSIAEDTVRNEYLRHPVIHEWLGQGIGAADVDTLNQKVYAELFLTPDSDPWLGLLPGDAYTAIANNGVVMGQG
jgi:hypothetical protein